MPLVFAPAVKSVALSTGVRLPYVEQGDPAGIPVLLLHGYSDSWHSFEPLLPHLPATIRAFALTQRGHGDADRPATGYLQPDFAADVAAFMDALGIDSAVVFGHSMGSVVAQHFGLAYPGRARGLALLGALADFRTNPAIVELNEIAATMTDPIDPAFVREFQESTLARPISPALLETFIEESLKVPARVWRATCAGFMEADWAEHLDRIAVPTLVLWGERDLYGPHADQDLLATSIPDARLIVYPGAGHAVHWEDPARVAADLVAFIDSLGS